MYFMQLLSPFVVLCVPPCLVGGGMVNEGGGSNPGVVGRVR